MIILQYHKLLHTVGQELMELYLISLDPAIPSEQPEHDGPPPATVLTSIMKTDLVS